jgi:hypothetical protein
LKSPWQTTPQGPARGPDTTGRQALWVRPPRESLCAHLAVAAENAGDGPVYLIDADPQGTSTTWHEARRAERPHRIETGAASLFRPGRGEGQSSVHDATSASRASLCSTLRTLDQTHPRRSHCCR